jgi:hypothetical protein
MSDKEINEVEPREVNGVKFYTHNDKEIGGVGTSLIGYIDISYAELKKTLGQPTDSDGYKSDAEWELEFEDGSVATIYNWKDGKNYNGSHGTPKTQIRDWHVGGASLNTIRKLKSLFPKATTKTSQW